MLGLDISTAEGLRKAVSEGYSTESRCPFSVRDAAALLEHLLAEEERKPRMTEETKRIDPEQVAQRAKHHFVDQGRSCSEACLAAGAEALGIESPLLPEIAVGFAGGIGMQGDVCGAVAGCAMAISLAAARKAQDYAGRKKLAVPAVGRLYRKFAEQCGSVRCADICGLDLTTEEGIAKLRSGARDEKCAPAVAKAARLLGEELNAMDAS